MILTDILNFVRILFIARGKLHSLKQSDFEPKQLQLQKLKSYQ